jgi:hypothetical protein
VDSLKEASGDVEEDDDIAAERQAKIPKNERTGIAQYANTEMRYPSAKVPDRASLEGLTWVALDESMFGAHRSPVIYSRSCLAR